MNVAIESVGPTPNTAGRAAWICLGVAWLCFLLPVPGLGLFAGWPLNLVAFILAIVAMSKKGAMAGLVQLLASLIASPIIYFVGLAVFVGAVASGGAYDDYKVRVKVSEGTTAAAVAKTYVSEFALSKGTFPSSNTEAAYPGHTSPSVASIDIGAGGVVQITFAGPEQIAGKTLALTPSQSGDKIEWSCKAGTLDARYRSPECR